nr:hypothetical protein [Tanacetum cinerariifolium]
ELERVDTGFAIQQNVLPKVGLHHAAQHQVAVAGRIAEGDNLLDHALKRGRALGHARRAHLRRSGFGEAGFGKLIDAGRVLGAGQRKLLYQRVIADVDDDLGHRPHVVQRVFFGVVAAPAGGRKHQHRRVHAHDGEEAVRAQVHLALGRNRAGKRDGPRGYRANHILVKIGRRE